MRKIYLCLLAVFFQLLAFSQPITIGTGTNTASNSPWNTFYGYSYVQTIYLASEINATGSITSVQFYYAGTALDLSDDITMYMGVTSKSNFVSTTDWEPLSNLTPVFSGTLAAATLPGLVTITLSTPFPYNGSGNLLIAVDENKTGNNGSTRFQGTTLTGSNLNRVLAISNDVTNPDPAAPVAGARTSTIGNIIINGLTAAPCQPATALAVSNISLTGVTATWSAPTSGNPVTQYNYEVRTSGAPGSGSTGLATSGNNATTTVNISGLSSSTFYTLYIRPDCGSGNIGSWISTTFTTLCGVNTLITQNFDGVTVPALPPCWAKVGTQGSVLTQITNPNSSPNTLYIYGSAATNQPVVALPAVSNAGAGTHQFKFNMRANFTVGGIIQIGYLTNPADSSTFVPLVNDTASTLTYKSFTFKPTGVTGSSVVFAIKHLGTPAYSLLIDDFSWEALAACAEPTLLTFSGITTTAATVNWTAPTPAPVSYDVYRSTTSTAPTGSTTPTATGIAATNYNLTGLVSATKYFVWVRSNCGVGGLSVWSVVDSFTTLCGPTGIPYTQDFESATIPGLPICTAIQNAGSGNNWVTANAPGSGFTSKTLRYAYNATNAADAWFFTQGLNLTAGTSYRLTFNYGNNSTTYIESMKVNFGTTANATSMTTNIIDYQSITGAVLNSSTNDFTPTTTGVYYIGFHAYSIANQFNLHLDDIVVTLSPTCDVPTQPNITNLATTSVTLNWTAPATAPASYDVYSSTSSVAPTGTTTPTATGITATTYNLTSLTPATKYFYWVRSNCGANGVSAWSVKDSLTTLPSCDVPTALMHSNVTGTGAQLDWTAPATGSTASYEIYRSLVATAPTGTTTPTILGITNTTYSLTGLTAATKYYVWVRSNCGTGGVSTWSVVDSFTTQCAATNIPYSQDFESATVPALPNCTSIENVGTGNNWVTASAPGNGFTSKALKYGYNSTNPADAWFYTQGLNLTAGTSYRLTFKYGNNSAATYTESMNVSYGTDANAASMSTLIVDYPAITGAVPNTSSTDFTPSSTGVYYIGYHVYSITNQYNLYVDDISVNVTPVCDAPTLLPVTSITGVGATINWNPPPTSPSGYDIYHSTVSTAPTGTTTPTVSGITNATYDFTTLNSSTKYYYWIRSNCGTGGVSAWTGIDSFTTLCGPTNIPYTQDFESATVPAMPNCTAVENVGTGNNWVTANNPGSGFTSKTLKYGYNTTNAADVWFYTQGLNLTAGTSYRITFRYGCNSATYTESMNVSYGTAANAASMTDLIVDYPSIKNVTPLSSTSDFTPTTSGVYYIGFHAYSIVNQFNLYVDDIVVNVTPTCDVPGLLPVSNILSSGATLNWNAPITSTVSYDAYYSTISTAPTASTIPTNAGIIATTVNLTGLTAATKYYYWLRSNCGAGGMSVWTSVDSFITACIPVPTFSENFATAITPNLPNCWSKILRGATIAAAATLTTTTTNAYSVPNAVTMYNSSSTSTDDIILVSPPVSNLAAGTYQLSFFAKNSVIGQDIEIGTMDDNSATANFTPLQTVTVTTAYQKFAVSFASYTGTDTYIGIRRINATTFSYVYVDDISWELIPVCVEPNTLVVSNIATTTAQLDWTAPSAGSPASYEVYYSTTNTPPTATTTPNATGITTTTYNFTGLTPASTYYAWVRSNCGTGGVSGWSAVATFITQCAAVTDFYQNFDAVTIPALPVCWSKVSTTGAANTQTTNPLSAPNTMYIYGSSATNQSVVKMTPVSNADLNTHRLRFSARGNFTAGATIQVGYLTDPTDATTFVSLQDVVVSTLTYQSYTVIPGSINPGSNTVFAFRHTGTPAYSVLIDDVYWEVLPGCVEPSSVVISNISLNSAQVDWTAPPVAPASYDVYYSTSNTPPTSTTTPSISGVTGTTTNLTSLLSSTTYYVWVRSNCGGTGGLSVWSSYATFTTLCGVVTAPTLAPEPFATVVPPSTCWSRAKGLLAASTTFSTITTSSWVIDDFTNRTTPVNKSARLNIWNTTTNDWLITPMYDLGAGGNFKLEFDLGYTTFGDTISATMGPDDKFAVVISTDNGVTWSDANVLRTWDATTPISNTGEHIVIDLASYSGVVMFGFYGESTISNVDNNVYVDNMEVLLRPVAVTLTSFKGERQGSKNILTWTTATEQNNKGFELQRSANGENFTTISLVNTKAINGTSNTTLAYNHVDEKPFSGNNYYRLKQIDKDGKSTISGVVLIKGIKVNALIVSSIYPNPAKNLLNIVLTAPVTEDVTLVVTDVAGKRVMQQSSKLLSGDNNLKVNVSRLLSGTYMIKAICNNGCETAVSKFIKE